MMCTVKTNKLAKAVMLTVAIVILTTLLFPIAASAEQSHTDIPFSCPAICADIGEKIDLSAYSVQFAYGNPAEKEIEWSSSELSLSEGLLTPEKAGVFTLSAKSGNKVKKIYLVVRRNKDSDFILYSNDFSADNGELRIIQQDAGGKLSYDTAAGTLVLDASASTTAYVRVLLPKFLDEFGDVNITTRFKIDGAKNNKRWGSLMFRVQNSNYPYYQLAMRSSASLENGLEIAERTSANKWNVVKSGPSSIRSSDYNTVECHASAATAEYILNGKTVLTESTVGYSTGGIGFQANGCRLTVDNVTVAVGKPGKLQNIGSIVNVRSPESNIILPPTVVANIGSASDLNDAYEFLPACAKLKINSSLEIIDDNAQKIATLDEVAKKLEEKVIPVFCPTDTNAATAVASFLSQNDYRDVFIMSKNANDIKEARKIWYHARGILDFTDKSAPSSNELLQMRRDANSADARVILLSAEASTKNNVSYLQQLFMTVWTASESSKTDMIKAIVSGANGIITQKPRELELCFTESFLKNTMTRTPEIIGHRGIPSLQHENSLESAKLAYSKGATIIENDIHLTKDGVIVVMHDDTIDRTTNGTGSVASMTLEQLRRFKITANKDLTEKAEIPTLEDYFKEFKGKDVRILVEIKSSDAKLIPAFVDLIKKYDFEDQLEVISFDTNQIKRLKELLPGISAGFLTSSTYSSTNMPLTLLSILDQVQTHGTTFNPTYGSGALTSNIIRELSYRGVTVWPWTLNDQNWFNTYFLAATHGVTTNFSQYAGDFVKKVYTDKTTYDLTAEEAPALVREYYGRNQKNGFDGTKMTVISSTGDISVTIDPETDRLVYTGNGTADVIFSVSYTASNKVYYTVSNVVTLKAEKAAETAADTSGLPETTNISTETNGCFSSASATVIVLAVTLLAATGMFVKSKE